MSPLPAALAPARVSMPYAALVDRLRDAGVLIEAPESDVIIAGATDDSRAIIPGDLFCAWAGTAHDSHAFVAAAASAGAVAAIVERRVDADIPQIVVTDGRRAAAIGAARVFDDPVSKLTLVGVTGTDGKTTSAWIMRHLLSARHKAAMIGTLGVWLDVGGAVPGSESLTTPGPVDLARLFRTLVDRGVSAIAMEVSSHALHQGRVDALRYDAALFTNLTRDHLDYHGTIEEYREAKRRFVELLRSNGTAVTNADDHAWDGVGERAPKHLMFSVDPERAADVVAREIRLTSEGALFDLVVNGRRAPVRLPLLGDFNVQNAIGAAAVCLSLGHDLRQVAEMLGTVPQVPGRLERIAQEPCPVLRDYAHTPDALERVLLTLRPIVEGRIIVVFGAGGDRDRGKRPEMGAIAQRAADVAIVTSDNPRTEDPDAIIDDIVAGMEAGSYRRITDRREAIAAALTLAQPGDLVLLAGKGHETYQVIGTTKHDFDERQVVREILASRREVA